MPSSGKELRSLGAVLAVIAVFYLLSFRSGHTWGDDFAMYLLHASNLAEGRAYADTGYLYNPAEPHLGPPVYPPVFPLLIAPVYRFAGLNLTAFKVVEVVFFLLFLAVVYFLFESYLPPAWRLALVALLGLNPYFWDFKDAIVSDLPAVFFTALALLIADRAYRSKRFPLAQAALLGVVMFLAYGTRTTAIVLLPALIAYELIRFRRITRFAIVAVAVAGVLMGGMALALTVVGKIPSLFRWDPRWIVSNGIAYAKVLRTFWLNGFSNAFSYAVFAIAYLLVLFGIWKQGRIGIFEVYAVLLLGVTFVYSVPGNYRYLFPILPLYLTYLLLGARAALQRAPSPIVKAAVAAGLVAVAATYAGAYSTMNWREIREGIGDPDFVALSDYIKQNSARADVLVFLKPRVLALLTGHPSATYPSHASLVEMESFLRQFHACYVVDTNLEHADFTPDRETLTPFLQAAGAKVERVYANPHYSLYRMNAW